MHINQLAQTRLNELETQQRLRTLTPQHTNAIIDLSSNDYLGLSRNPELLNAGLQYAQKYGVGATGSRLLSGNRACFEYLEQQLAQFKHSESALVFCSGYQANATVLTSLLSPHLLTTTPLVFTDRLIHASLHHACQLAGIRQIRFRHNDMNHLQECLKKYNTPADQPKWIVTETVFGMDGDLCPVADLAELALTHHAAVYLDEAHASGVFGVHGSGLSTLNHPAIHTLREQGNWVAMGTLSKAFGVSGGYVACSATLQRYLINQCTGFMYSTAPSPFTIGAILKALELMPKLEPTRKHLLQLSMQIRIAAQEMGLEIGQTESQIIPIIVHSTEQALSLHTHLAHDNILAPVIRPPTVPAGSSRVRLVLHSGLENTHMTQLIDSLNRWSTLNAHSVA